MPRVVLADDHPLYLQALQAAVERVGVEVVGTATRSTELLALLAETEVDAVLLDLAMPGADGFECIEQVRRMHPELPIMVVSGSDDDHSVRRAMEAGAVCFVSKSAAATALAGAIHVLLSDAVHVAPSHRAPERGAREAPTDATDLLTGRELEILRLVSNGLSNGDMARSLWVTEQTIKFHLSNIYRKIGVANRTGASRWAQRNGLLDDPGPE